MYLSNLLHVNTKYMYYIGIPITYSIIKFIIIRILIVGSVLAIKVGRLAHTRRNAWFLFIKLSHHKFFVFLLRAVVAVSLAFRVGVVLIIVLEQWF